MNCKPGQMAWIVVPREYHGTGMEALDGHMVKTLTLLPGYSVPVWDVTPPQRVVCKVHGRDYRGQRLAPGELLQAHGVPDAFLRPFDPRSAPPLAELQRELEKVS